jgi:predicted AAA+ superfamily ATPase
VGAALARSPVVGILGPRQCGKTTLARQVVAELKHTWFDLEDPVALRQLEEPLLAFEAAQPFVVLDEVQRAPVLFPLLRVLVDRHPERRYLVLGSASPDLLRLSSESLAGRIEYLDLSGFSLGEVPGNEQRRLWLRGGFPRSFLADSDPDSFAWRESFVRTFLERDLSQLELGSNAAAMRRFWTMLAHYHGQLWNASEVGRSLGVSDKTARRYLDILEGTFVIRQLHPWHVNLGKRLVKAPKVYIRDSGLLHTLLGLGDLQALLGHPKAGASWEGFALEQVLAHVAGQPWFWATHAGAELDLLLLRRKNRWGFEFKLSTAPALTRSMHVALQDLELDHLWVVHPGEQRIRLAERITALPIHELLELEQSQQNL